MAAGQILPDHGTVFISVRDRDKRGAVQLAKRFSRLGFGLVATRGTAAVLKEAGLDVEVVNKVHEGRPHIIDLIKNGRIAFIVNTALGHRTGIDAMSMRRSALLYKVPYVTTMAAAFATAEACASLNGRDLTVKSLQEYHAAIRG
jgi:carbamoyl-phosphate synthase large subunit